MNILARFLTFFFAVLALSAEAKTTKYDLEEMHSNPGHVHYPKLDLANAQSVVLTVNRNAPLYEPQLVSLEITFPTATKLTVTNFKLVDNKYRAVVNGAWIYKEIIIEVEAPPRFTQGISMISAYVSERTAFIDPQTENQNQEGLLFTILGNLRDITAVRYVDTVAVALSGKKVTFSLRDRPQVNANPGPGNLMDGFVVDVLWYGRGTKTLHVQAPIAPWDFDSIEVIAIVINGVSDFDRTLSIKFKDRNGTEMISGPTLIKNWLEQAYGPFVP
jgi:hypothetical protein